MGNKKASRLADEKAAEARRRFMEDALSAKKSGNEGDTQQLGTVTTPTPATQASSAESASSSSSRTSLLPPDYELSAMAVEVLTRMHDFWVSYEVPEPLKPLEAVEMIVGMQQLTFTITDPDKLKRLPPWGHDLIQAVGELEDASMDSLSPKLQFLKRGFEQLELDPLKPKGVQRRINDALRAEGEVPDFKTVFSDWRIDRSTIPPTRVLKTAADRAEEGLAVQRRLKSLRRRKPKLHANIMAIMAEEYATLPADGLPPMEDLPGGGTSMKFQLQSTFYELGYAGTLEQHIKRLKFVISVVAPSLNRTET